MLCMTSIEETLNHLGVTRWGKNEASNVEISWKIQRLQMPLL